KAAALPQHPTDFQGTLSGLGKMRPRAVPRGIVAERCRLWLGEADQLLKMGPQAAKSGDGHGSSSSGMKAIAARLSRFEHVTHSKRPRLWRGRPKGFGSLRQRFEKW